MKGSARKRVANIVYWLKIERPTKVHTLLKQKQQKPTTTTKSNKIASELAWHRISSGASAAIEKWIIWDFGIVGVVDCRRICPEPHRTIVWHECINTNARANIMNMERSKHGQTNIFEDCQNSWLWLAREWARESSLSVSAYVVLHEVKTTYYIQHDQNKAIYHFVLFDSFLVYILVPFAIFALCLSPSLA